MSNKAEQTKHCYKKFLSVVKNVLGLNKMASTDLLSPNNTLTGLYSPPTHISYWTHTMPGCVVHPGVDITNYQEQVHFI